MAKAGPRKIAKCGEKFKATAVKLSGLPGVLIQDVAAALDIHPFMLSLWRKQVREGIIVARASKLDVETAAELRRLKELERRYKVLKEEHEGRHRAARHARHRHAGLRAALPQEPLDPLYPLVSSAIFFFASATKAPWGNCSM